MTKTADFLLIGGGLASAFNAEALRKEGVTGSIVILAEEKFLPYYRPQLPIGYLLGTRTKEQILIFQELFYKKNQIDVLCNTQALAVDPAKKCVKTDKYGVIHYDKLLIATGCSPRKVDIPGSKLKKIYYFKNITDADPIIKEIPKAKQVVIYGGSFIGIELASVLVQKGIKVSIVTEEFGLFNVSPSEEVGAFITSQGVKVYLNQTIKKFNGKQRVQSIETSKGKVVDCDFVFIAEEYEPDTEFLQGSGIAIDDGVVVDQYLQTNKPDIFAAGDVANFYDPVFRKCHRIGGIDNAMKQGRISALNMMGMRKCYNTACYFYFHAFDCSIVLIGDTSGAKEKIIKGSVKSKNFSIFYMKDGLLQGAFFSRRPIEEIKAAESLILNRVNIKPYKKQLSKANFSLEDIAIQKVLTLQGGGALGAFECGVVKAMEELGLCPDIVSGISIGAFNSAIIASNPHNAAEALDAFWSELACEMPSFPNEETRRLLSSWHSIMWGSPNFFFPRWAVPFDNDGNVPLPMNWTSFYDNSWVKDLLHKYVDFANLKNSPIRLLVMAVNVETSEFETFDSYTDDITVDHILASGSLPPGFPWTTINGKHYWDGGIITNTPVDTTLEVCGSSHKQIYIVELYSRTRALPTNMIEVLARKDEILFSEKIRRDMYNREEITDYKKLVHRIMSFLEPELAGQIKQIPSYIQMMGDPGIHSITRIMRDVKKDAPYAWDSDFSSETIEQHKKQGYQTAKEILTHDKKQLSFVLPLDKSTS